MNQPHSRPDDMTTGELMAQLSSQTSRLVRDEMRLAQVELKESVKHAGVGAGLFTGTGLLGVFGLGCLITAAIAALSLVVPLWAAAVIIAVVLFAAAGVAAVLGKKQIDEASPTPEMTVSSVKQDLQEVKDARHAH